MVYRGEPYDQDYFEGTREEGYSGYGDGSVERVQRYIADDIEAELGSVSGKRVLDIGCGYGYLVDELANRGADVVGLDISSYAISRARELFPMGEFNEVDFFNNGFSNNEFDIIVSCGGPDCLTDKDMLKDALSEVKRILKPQGKVYVLASLTSEFYLLLTELEWDTEMKAKFQNKTVTVTNVGSEPLGWDVRVTAI